MPKENKSRNSAGNEGPASSLDDLKVVSTMARSSSSQTDEKREKKKKDKNNHSEREKYTDDEKSKDESRSIKKEKKKKKDKKRKLTDDASPSKQNETQNGGDKGTNSNDEPSKEKLKKEKKKKQDKTRKSESKEEDGQKSKKRRKCNDETESEPSTPSLQTKNQIKSKKFFPFEYQHIVAPMVGASELAFRLLCRKYGATLAYTPMMSSSQFVKEAKVALENANDNNLSTTKSATNAKVIASSNICEFQTIPQDRPLVAHFSANNPQHFAEAAKLVSPLCDAIDLNLGCPQRTAFLGHFGSYLLGDEDRQLVLDIVRAGSQATPVPIFVKIRLLDTIEETIKLCHQLRDAGASLIAIHGRYRASWERTGASARDGPALLDQIAVVKQSMLDFPIISNGNVITYDDVVSNQQFTGADGIMSAEGILNNPALYLPRLGDASQDAENEIVLPVLSPLHGGGTQNFASDKAKDKIVRKLQKKLREIETIEAKMEKFGECSINEDQRSKLKVKSKIQSEIIEVENSRNEPPPAKLSGSMQKPQTTTMKLHDLLKTAENKLALAKEYLSLVRLYPMKIRSVVFHTRRMCKDLLEKYQLMEECIASTSVDEVEAVLSKCELYIERPNTFIYDLEKAAKEKEALKRKRQEEGKRKAFEGRMTRKAKREGLDDLDHYLRIGAEVPTVEVIKRLKMASKEERMEVWKKDHSQHCMSHHLENGGCKRDRACAFLHVEAKDANTFVAGDEVAG